MDRKMKLLLLGQQQYSKQEDSINKRKVISPGKDNPTPNVSKKGSKEDATSSIQQERLTKQLRHQQSGVLCEPSDQLVTPEHEATKPSCEPQLEYKGFPNAQENFTEERVSKPAKKEEKSSKVQRVLTFGTDDVRANNKMKSGIKFNRMTNVGFDTPPCSPFIEEEKRIVTSDVKVDMVNTVPAPIPAVNLSNGIVTDLAIKLPANSEAPVGCITICSRRKMTTSLKSFSEGVIVDPSMDLSPIVLNDICLGEANKDTLRTITGGLGSVDINARNIDEVDDSNHSQILLGHAISDFSTPVKNSFASFSEDCSFEDSSQSFNDHLKRPKETNISFSADSLDETSQPFNDHLKALRDLPEVNSPELDDNNDDTLEQSGTKDHVSLIEDLEHAGITVSEEVIVMSISPFKNQEETVPNSEAEGYNVTNHQDVTENQRSPPERDDPDDPDYVVGNDPTAPENLSGLDSDAGSAGESPKPRRRNPQNWKKNKRTEKNSKGLEHVGSNGKVKQSRDVIPAGCNKKTCKRNCHGLVTLEQRQQINKNYWSIGNASRQWDYLGRHIRILPVKRRTGNVDDPYRKNSYQCFLTIDNKQVQVCQKMLLTTLNISVARIKTSLRKMTSKDGVISPDKRGRNTKRKLHPSTTASMKTHIESFPTYESHYVRRSSKKKYLDEKLNVSIMYRHYAASRPSDMHHTATLRQYEDYFRTNYKHKLGFFKPKKDQCGTCLRWKNLSPEEKLNDENKVKYEKHINNKQTARKIKDENIKLGQDDKQVCVASFDLQKVFFCPYGENGEFIFRRKLRCYNLSVFQSISKVGYCYVWDETTAKKGAVEISSCVWSFIEMKVAEGFTKFYFVSDNAWNQNKNAILFAMYNMASIKFDIEIRHTYLEKGHTQMECDSIHSLIERRCKNLTLCTPQAWYGVIRTAKVPSKRKNNSPYLPYVVKVMTKENIYDFKTVMNEQNFAKIPKSKVREIHVSQNVAKFKQEFNGVEEKVSLLKKRTGRPVNFKTYTLKKMYSHRLPLKPDQLKDLLWLCDQKHIPEPDSEFFYTLAREIQMQQQSGLHAADEDGENQDSDDGDTESEDSAGD